MTFRSRAPIVLTLFASLLIIPVQYSLQAQPPAAQAACPANPAWIQKPSQPNFAVDPTTLCGFYQYSWQSFLYLTSPSPSGALVFESFPSVQDVFNPPMPTALRTLTDARIKQRREFLPRFGKPSEAQAEQRFKAALAAGASFDEDQQAGSNGVLVSQTNLITYYEELLDQVSATFVNACSLQIAACQTAPAAAKLRMPTGAIEIKASWLPMMKSTPNVGRFYTIPGFPVMNNQGATFTPDFMALVGFHLVFATRSHPELIWASFEHVANAPDGPCVPGKAALPPSGFKTWTYNNIADTTCKNVNTWPSPAPTKPPFPMTQAVRVNPSGGGGADNVATIQSINQSVLKLLPATSIWRNYFLVGGIWTDGTLPPTPANEKGSLALANSTMETFTQGTTTQPFSCFTCHNARGGQQPPFDVSHAFLQARSGNCSYSTQLPAACTATQK